MSNNKQQLKGGNNRMSYKNLKERAEGFTIIEVLIVLAIAGLIMLIVFLAVPALQRNSRNNGRNSDASRVAAAVTECLSNRNGQTASCNNVDNVVPGQLSQFTDANPIVWSGSIGSGSYSTTHATVVFNAACSDDGAEGDTPGPTPRSFVVLYALEAGGVKGDSNDITRCLQS